ncbi:MAG TPA: hypothetical protein VMI33_10700 [Streptosporangiaceae bacterium]|nr:hypothetical protein [Streptosporangiaceae bacterium]
MSSEVSDLVKALQEGTMTLDQVAQRFRERKWPRRRRPPPATYLEMAARAQEDPEPYDPNSFDDVTAAYHRGELSDAQYDTLAEAMAESKRAEDRRLAEEQGGQA